MRLDLIIGPNGAGRTTIAERTRAALIEARLPFIAETVFSHESKLELIRSAKAAGYLVVLHVVLVTVEVPEKKIRGGYARLWPLVRIAISLSDSASVWDNNALDRQPRRVARFVQGFAVEGPNWPSWTPTGLTDPLPSR